MICLKPSEIDIQEHANSSLHNVFKEVQGRLMWSEADSSWCVDSSEGTPSGNLINSGGDHRPTLITFWRPNQID